MPQTYNYSMGLAERACLVAILAAGCACIVQEHPDWVGQTAEESGAGSEGASEVTGGSESDDAESSADSGDGDGDGDSGDGDSDGGDGDGDGDGPYGGWSHSAGITLDTTGEGAGVPLDVSGFPVLIHIDSQNKPTPDFFAGETLPGGADLRFTTAPDTGMALAYEIEAWNGAGENALIWVRVPTVLGDTASEQLRMYWGNEKAAPESAPAQVFSGQQGFSGVWHMNDNTMGSNVADARGMHDGLYENGPTGTQSQAGLIAGALRFDGAPDYVRVPYHPDFDPEDGITLSAWVFTQETGGFWRPFFTKNLGNTNESSWIGLYRDANDPANWTMRTGQTTSDGPMALAGVWTHVAMSSVVGGPSKLYVNGAEVAEHINQPGVPELAADDVVMGRALGAPDFFVGILDEVRWSREIRGPLWLRLAYQNQRVNQKLVTIENP